MLQEMLNDEAEQAEVFRLGDYWRQRAELTVAKIKEVGISNFRGYSGIGFGCVDCSYIDVRTSLLQPQMSLLDRLIRATGGYQKIESLFEEQVKLTNTWREWYRMSQIRAALRNSRTTEIVSKYVLENTLGFDCKDTMIVAGKTIARHYVVLLDQHDVAAETLDFKAVHSVLEIGGGFGANIHILLMNYPNIRKVIYLDTPPYLYLGTSYLRSLYPDSVFDYNEVKNRQNIKFNDDDSIEIFCIAPWQIEKVLPQIDLFWCAHSVMTMSADAVRRYAEHAQRLFGARPQIGVVNYELPLEAQPFPIESLPDFFPGHRFQRRDVLGIESAFVNHYFLSGPEY